MSPRQAGEAARETEFSLLDRKIGLMTGPYHGARTAPPQQMRHIDDLPQAYREQVRFLLADYRAAIEKDIHREQVWKAGSTRIEDIFLEGTVYNAVTLNDGGTPCHKSTIQGNGLPSVIDCLAALEKLVFRDKELSLTELAVILRED